MPVYLPKRVGFANPKLKILQVVLKVFTFVAVVAYFFSLRLYGHPVDISEYLQVSIWQNFEAKGLAARVHDMNVASPICTSPHMYDYWWDSEGQWRFTNHTCMEICPHNASELDCLPLPEVAMPTDFPPRVFIPTHIMDEFFPREGTNCSTTECPKTANYFVMSAELVGVGFSFKMEVGLPGFMGEEKSSIYKASSLDSVEDGFAATTMVLDSKDRLWRTIPPSASIDLSLSDLLVISGRANSLNEINKLAGKNQMPGAKAGGPLSRISGLEFEMTLECYNPHQVYPRDLPIKPEDFEGPLCVVKVAKQAKGWVAKRRQDLLDVGLRSRVYHGILIKVRTAGIIEVPDWNKIYLNLVSLLVMLTVPTKLVFFIATTFLGNLSKVYSRALYEEFNILAEIAGSVTRRMTSSAAFVLLEDIEDVNGDGEGISKQRVVERLRRSYNQSGIDPVVERALADFHFNSVVTDDGRPLRRWIDKLTGANAIPETVKTPETIGMSIEKFCDLVATSERLPFPIAMGLFQERRMSWLERLFTPPLLWAEIEAAKAADSQPPLDPSRSMEVHRGKTMEIHNFVEHALKDRLIEVERRLDHFERLYSRVGEKADKLVTQECENIAEPRVTQDADADSRRVDASLMAADAIVNVSMNSPGTSAETGSGRSAKEGTAFESTLADVLTRDVFFASLEELSAKLMARHDELSARISDLEYVQEHLQFQESMDSRCTQHSSQECLSSHGRADHANQEPLSNLRRASHSSQEHVSSHRRADHKKPTTREEQWL